VLCTSRTSSTAHPGVTLVEIGIDGVATEKRNVVAVLDREHFSIESDQGADR